jgi:hypothetical protein
MNISNYCMAGLENSPAGMDTPNYSMAGLENSLAGMDIPTRAVLQDVEFNFLLSQKRVYVLLHPYSMNN